MVEKAEVQFVHVRGHAGDPMNERCDHIANEQAKAAAPGEQPEPGSESVRQQSEHHQTPTPPQSADPEPDSFLPWNNTKWLELIAQAERLTANSHSNRM